MAACPTRVLPSRQTNIHNLREGLLRSCELTLILSAARWSADPGGTHHSCISESWKEICREWQGEKSVLDCAQSTHLVAADLHSLCHHECPRWRVALGARSAGGRGIERCTRWLAGPRTQSTHHAGTVSRSHRGQTVVEFALPGACLRWEDSLEIYGCGTWARRADRRDLHGAVSTVGFRDFRPSIFGKINTVCEIGAVFFVVLAQVVDGTAVQ